MTQTSERTETTEAGFVGSSNVSQKSEERGSVHPAPELAPLGSRPLHYQLYSSATDAAAGAYKRVTKFVHWLTHGGPPRNQTSGGPPFRIN